MRRTRSLVFRGLVLGLVACAAFTAASRAATYEQTVLGDNPYGYWRFNESSGTVAQNLGSAGAAMNGSYAQYAPPDGVPSLGAAGIPGGGAGNTAAAFAGNSQVYIPDASAYSAYTLEAWVRPDTGTATAQNVLVRTQSDPRTTWSHQLFLAADAKPHHRTWDGAARELTAPAAAGSEKWTHIVGTAVNGTGLRLYVNGVDVGNTGLGTMWADGNQWRIGSPAGGGTGEFFRGAIDEVAIYKTALTPTQIVNHYAAGTTQQTAPPATVPAPSAWLKADAILGKTTGDPVSVWGDASGNNNHLVQATAAAQPTYVASGINSLPTVRFDGTDFITALTAVNNPYTVFAVTRMEGTQSLRLVTSGDTTDNWLLGNWGGRQNVMHAGGWVESETTISADTQPHLWAASNDGSKTTFWHNGQALAWNSGGVGRMGRLQLGGWGTGNGEASKGDVSEVIVYDRALTVPEQVAVQTYLTGKYGLTMYGPAVGQAGGFAGPGDLDLAGDFLYAVNVSPTASDSPKKVLGATFTADTATPGVSVSASNSIDNWGTRPEYGSTTDDDNLEAIMHDIRHGANNAVTANLHVVPGNTYKLQLLFSETYTEPGKRPFDINLEGALVHDEFDPVYYRGTWGSLNRGAVYTTTFVAGDNTVNVSLTPGSTGGDKNPIFNAFTLEQIATAATVAPPIGNAHIRLSLGETGTNAALDSALADGPQHGTWTGTPTQGVPGIPVNAGVNTAVQLNGTQQLTVMDAPQLTGYTIEAWVNPASLANMNILDRTSSNVGHVSHQLRMTAAGKFEHYTYDGTGRLIAGSTTAQAGQWYHVVATATNGGRMQLFVNGQLQNESGNLGTLWASGDRWRIAGTAGPAGSTYGNFNGTLDEVSITSSVTPGEQIFVRYRNAALPVVKRDAVPQAGYAIVSMDLADVVGHGNGFGTGAKTAGIHPVTGALIPAGTPAANSLTGAGFQAVPDLPFVDGVFVVGTGGYLQIATTGLQMQHNYPARNGLTWDHYRNGPTAGTSSTLGGVDYSSAGHSLIGLHANKGITFDLDAIRAANGNTDVNQFTCVYGDVTPNDGNTDFNVYLDGRLVYGIGGNLTGQKLQIPISQRNRFLTLLATDGGDTYNNDQFILGDPRLELAKNIAYNKPVGATAMYSTAYAPTNIVDGDVNEDWNAGSDTAFWLLPDGQLGSAVVDLEGEFLIGRIDLQNTHNGGARDRGTNEFRLLGSLDGIAWDLLVDSSLTRFSPANSALLNTPLETFEFEPAWARYVKFQIDSYYGVGGGLAEMRVFEHVPEPATMALTALALTGLGGYVRRRQAGMTGGRS